MILKKSKIFIAGHNGLVGSSVLRKLKFLGYKKITTITKKNLDLRNQQKVINFFKKNKFDAVINAAGKVGGIFANEKYKADFIYDNLSIQNNIINSSYATKVKSLIFLGSSCIYPKNCNQPIKEEYLMTGELEKTNEAYAVAKIAGIKMCESYNYQYGTQYKCLMPCNVYGPNDNYNLETAHFFPALLSKIFLAKKKNLKNIVIWGSGKPKRELMYVDDLADACILFLNKKTKETLINIGSGIEHRIIDYAKFILKKLNYNCKIDMNNSMPDGTKRKILDSSIAKKHGWKPKISLEEGFKFICEEYIKKNKI
jgi:GDP-L-fucose synthase